MSGSHNCAHNWPRVYGFGGVIIIGWDALEALVTVQAWTVTKEYHHFSDQLMPG